MSTSLPVVWSCGGGVQSAAIAVLIEQGRLPTPDRAIIVDTGYEASTTWKYFDKWIHPRMRAVGLEVERVSKATYTKVDVWHPNGMIHLPVYRIGVKFPTFCSSEWKTAIIARHLKATGVKACESWIGISADEASRVRTKGKIAWQRLSYPLIYKVPLTRKLCISEVLAAGWDMPPRSSCFMCPNHSNASWRDLDPEDMAQAIEFEHKMREIDPTLFLHRSCKPLESVRFTNDDQATVDGCSSGNCFT